MDNDFDPEFEFDFTQINLVALRSEKISTNDIKFILLNSGNWIEYDETVRIALGPTIQMRFLKIAFSYNSRGIITIRQVGMPDLDEIKFVICK